MRENRKADTAALGIFTVMCGIIAMGAIPQWLTIIGVAATLMFMSCTIYVAFAGRKPKPQLATSDPQPRQLATTAQDEAAKAADLGLPTGIWTDLAATWTTWADQDDADEPAETAQAPVKRPTPPAGDGGAGNVPWIVDAPAGLSHVALMKLAHAIAQSKPTQTGALRDSIPVQRALPQACATKPVTDQIDFGVGGHFIEVPRNRNLDQRTDLIVWVGAPSAGYPRLIPNVRPTFTAADFDGQGEVIARVVMPPNTSTVAQCQITDLRAS